MPATLNCRKLADNLEAYVSGALSEDDRWLVDSHLKSCAGCREQLKQVKAVQGLLVSTIGPGTLSSDFAKNTGQRVREAAPAAKAERVAISNIEDDPLD